MLGFFFRGFNYTFDRITGLYGWTIGAGLRLAVIVLLAYGGLLLLTYYVFRDAPTGFVPQQDMGRLIVSVQLPDSASAERTVETPSVHAERRMSGQMECGPSLTSPGGLCLPARQQPGGGQPDQ